MKYIILTCLLAFEQLSLAQNSVNLSAGITSPRDYITVIPYENINGKLIITAEINEHPRRFIFDTGASGTLINKNILDSSDLSNISLPSIDQSGKEDSLSVAILNSIQIGNAIFGNVPVMTLDGEANPILKCFEVDGILGNNLWTHTAVRITSVDKTISITDNPSKFALNKEQSSDILFPCEYNCSPFIETIFINNDGYAISEPVLFDSGANLLYRLSSDNIKFF